MKLDFQQSAWRGPFVVSGIFEVLFLVHPAPSVERQLELPRLERLASGQVAPSGASTSMALTCGGSHVGFPAWGTLLLEMVQGSRLLELEGLIEDMGKSLPGLGASGDHSGDWS
jgi:hypothetical protein